jgi:hypothetical protein
MSDRQSTEPSAVRKQREAHEALIELGLLNPGESLEDGVLMSELWPDPDWKFVCQRLKEKGVGIGDDQFSDAFVMACIDLLRSDVPLSRSTRDMLANHLASMFWPKFHAQYERETRVERDRACIDVLSLFFKAKGVGNYRGEAERQWAHLRGVSVSALRQRRYRKPAARNRDL